MTKTVPFIHNNQAVQIAIEDHIDLWTSQTKHPVAFIDEDFAHAVHDALQHPTGYPPVSSGVVPGDTVAIVIDPEVPSPDAAIAGVLRALAPLELTRIDVVVAESATEETRSLIRVSLPEGVEFTIHSGKSRDDLRYLAANEAADPIYLNRRIVDADLVIPISVSRYADPLLAGSLANAVFPALADYRSQARARLTEKDIATINPSRRHVEADDEATRVGWLLGLQWLVAIEVDVDGKPSGVFAGTSESLAAHAKEAATSHEVPFLADVVVACIDGGRQQQSLCNLLRAALVARSQASLDGSIVLVTDLEELGVLVEPLDEYEEVDEEDSEPADSELADRAPVISANDHARQMLSYLINNADSSQRYLMLSDCNVEEVESFGFGFVQDVSAIERLVNAHQCCSVIRNASLAAPRSDANRSLMPERKLF